MCGIAGCVGHEHQQAPAFVLEAIETLEYRGHDSAGIAVPGDERLEIAKTLGGVASLRENLAPEIISSGTAIGHTRWATHGSPNLPNGHPHTNEDDTIAVVCNGIVENYKDLRSELRENGYDFSSETDTEVVPHLFDYYLRDGTEPEEAFRLTLNRLRGAYAILALAKAAPDTMYAAAVSGNLLLGLNGSEHFAASDPSLLTDSSKDIVRLDDYNMAVLSKDGTAITDIRTARQVDYEVESIDEVQERASKGEFAHFMLKEIYDSAETVRSATRGRVRPEENLVKLGGLEDVEERLKDIDRVIIVACGTSYYAGLIGEQLIEEIAGIPVEVEVASEFKDREQPFDKKTAIIAISQSGETADTIAALKKAQEFGLLKLGVVNTPASRIAQMTDAGVYCHAGQEVSVASTKAFTSQVTVLTEMAISMAKSSNRLNQPLLEELIALPDKIDELLSDTTGIEAAADKYKDFSNFLFIGRGYNLPAAMEGALKLKEVSYIHAEGYGAGEMKHGPLAMIDEDFPTVAIATDGPQLEKTMSNIKEIRARQGRVLALATLGNETVQEDVDDVLYIPASLEQTQPILNSIALQLFAYYVAVKKDLNVDRPRNLAKSVTVE